MRSARAFPLGGRRSFRSAKASTSWEVAGQRALAKASWQRLLRTYYVRPRARVRHTHTPFGSFYRIYTHVSRETYAFINYTELVVIMSPTQLQSVNTERGRENPPRAGRRAGGRGGRGGPVAVLYVENTAYMLRVRPQRVRPAEALRSQGTASWPVVPSLTPPLFTIFSSVTSLCLSVFGPSLRGLGRALGRSWSWH